MQFFFEPQVRSELLLWVCKFGRILWVFKLLNFIDEARTNDIFLLQVVLYYKSFVMESARLDSQFQTMVSGVYERS